MRVCTYIVKHDVGLAPNPFWGWCTLAVCTPNHMGIKLEKGDWIVGFLSKSRQNKLLYAMKLYETRNFDDYYHAKAFYRKIPNLDGSWKEQCGDNIYFRDSNRKWTQATTRFHKGIKDLKKDTKHPRVYIAKEFYYFGDKAIYVPARYQALIPIGQGVRCNHDQDIVNEFLEWLVQNHSQGVLGNPNDREEGCKKGPKGYDNGCKGTKPICNQHRSC